MKDFQILSVLLLSVFISNDFVGQSIERATLSSYVSTAGKVNSSHYKVTNYSDFKYVISGFQQPDSLSFVALNEHLGFSFLAYPNPVRSELIVQGEGITRFELLDLNGKIISKCSVQPGEVIDFTDVDAGTYLLLIYDRDNRKGLQKVVKL